MTLQFKELVQYDAIGRQAYRHRHEHKVSSGEMARSALPWWDPKGDRGW